jgi:hypothetical protein
MAPRRLIASVGYAFRALTADTIGAHTHNGADIASGVVSIPYGGTGAVSAAAARTNLGAAASGANPDITSLSGLTTPLSVSQGGTGAATKNFVDLSTAQTVGGAKTFSSPVASTVATGTAPLSVASTTLVTNLNADYLDGQHATAFALAAHNHDTAYYTKTYIDALEARIAALETKLAHLTRSGDNLYFTGANLHIRSGSGSTGGTINGLGNLIVGYNEARASGSVRTGSHNLIVGRNHNFSSYGGIVAGYENTISGGYASVTGGVYNMASGLYSSVTGGTNNDATNTHSSVSGGENNTASGTSSSVSGGVNNTASGYDSSVTGGYQNIANGDNSSVSGGNANTASGANASVSGGANNTAGQTNSSVSGGQNNSASGTSASISGGRYNVASGDYSAVVGGGSSVAANANKAVGHYSAILGGAVNVAGDPAVTDHNIGAWSAILGGWANVTSRNYSVSIPHPAYDSGWVAIARGQAIRLTHNLGGDPNKYIVDFMQENETGKNIDGYGSYALSLEVSIGAKWSNLDQSTIVISRGSGDWAADRVRVRIYVNN